MSSSISFQLPQPGIWTVTGEFAGQIVTQRINVTDKGSTVPVSLVFSSATITVTSPVGTSLLLTDGTNQITATSTGTNVFTIYNMGQWTVSGTLEGYALNSVTVNVSAGQNYPVQLEIQTATLTVTAPAGTIVTVTGGGDTQEITATNGTAVFQLTALVTYQVSGTLNGLASNTVSVDVTDYAAYTATLTVEAASIVVTTLEDVFVTAQNGAVTLTATATGGQATFQTQTFGEWTISGTLTGYTFTPQTVNVQAYQQYDVSLEPLVATITVTAPNGTEVVAENSAGQQVQGYVSDGTAVLEVYSLDTWTVSGTQNGLVTNSVPVTVSEWTNYPVTLTIWAATITVTTPTGTLVTAQNGDTQIQATASNNQVIFAVQLTGNWTVSAQFDTQSDSEVVDVQDETDYPVRLWVPTIVPTVATGSVVTCTQGDTALTKTSQSGKVKFYVPTLGEWTLNATLNEQSSNTVIVDVQEDRDYPLLLNYTFATITVATVAGTEVTAQNGAIIITQTADSNGEAVFEVATFGTWTVSASFDGELVSADVEVSEAINYDVELKSAISLPEYYGTADNLSNPKYSFASSSNSGFCLFAGGNLENGSVSSSVDAYSSELVKSTPQNLSVARGGFCGASVGNYFLFAGGNTSFQSQPQYASKVVDAYNLSFVRTSPTPLSSVSYYLAATSISGRAFFGGGYGGGSTVNTYTESLTLELAANLSSSRYYLSAGSVGGYAIFAGGFVDVDVVDSYDSNLTKIELESLSSGRYFIAAAKTQNNLIFAGGVVSGSPSSIVDSYNGDLTRIQAEPLSVAKESASGIGINGLALIAGGVDNGASVYSSVVDCYNDSLVRTTIQPLPQGWKSMVSGSAGNYAIFAGGARGINQFNELTYVYEFQ